MLIAEYFLIFLCVLAVLMYRHRYGFNFKFWFYKPEIREIVLTLQQASKLCLFGKIKTFGSIYSNSELSTDDSVRLQYALDMLATTNKSLADLGYSDPQIKKIKDRVARKSIQTLYWEMRISNVFGLEIDSSLKKIEKIGKLCTPYTFYAVTIIPSMLRYQEHLYKLKAKKHWSDVINSTKPEKELFHKHIEKMLESLKKTPMACSDIGVDVDVMKSKRRQGQINEIQQLAERILSLSIYHSVQAEYDKLLALMEDYQISFEEAKLSRGLIVEALDRSYIREATKIIEGALDLSSYVEVAQAITDAKRYLSAANAAWLDMTEIKLTESALIKQVCLREIKTLWLTLKKAVGSVDMSVELRAFQDRLTQADFDYSVVSEDCSAEKYLELVEKNWRFIFKLN